MAATKASVTANSLQGQVDQLAQQFNSVKQAVSKFEGQEQRARTLLNAALTDVFTFGEMMYSTSAPAGTNLFREFFTKMGRPYNAKTQANPYIGLVKLAFNSAGDSSLSQYARVLQYAHDGNWTAGDFLAQLNAKGIEGLRKDALEADESQQSVKRNAQRTAKIDRASNMLMAKPASQAVALPSGLQAPEGFAIVLARIDASNNASIVELVHTDAAKVDPILLKLVDDGAPTHDGEALAPFFRALDLILNTTPDKGRDVLIRNVGGKVSIQAISEGHSFPGALMELDGSVPGLPDDEAFVLKSADARGLLNLLDKFSNWAIADGAITADDLPQPLHLEPITKAGKYRVAVAPTNDDKPLQVTHTEFGAVMAYIDGERAAHAKKNKGRSEQHKFATSIELSLAGSRLVGKLPTSMLSTTIGSTGSESDLDDRLLALSDVEALTGTMKQYEVDAHGWIMDNEVDDAGLVLEAYFDNDKLQVVLPTRTGSSYNQVCEPLVL